MSLLKAGLTSPDGRLDGPMAIEQARRLACGLRALKIGENDRVALLMWNDTPFFTLGEACQLVGAYLVPLNWRLASPELRYILQDCEAKVLFGHAALLQAAGFGACEPFSVVAKEAPPFIRAAYPKYVHPEPGSWEPEWLRWEALLAASSSRLEESPRAERGGVFYTSGTTGKPKGVVRAALPSEVWAELHGRSIAGFGLDVTSGDRIITVQAGPLYHSAPNAYAQLVWRGGGEVVIMPRFDAQTLLHEIARARATHLHLVPTMLKRLIDLDKSERDAVDISSLISICHGAAPCPPEVKRSAVSWLGPVIREYYAGTETGIVAWSTSAQWLARPGTVGRAAVGVDIRIIDSAGLELPAGIAGEVIARSASTTSFHYHGRDEAHGIQGWEGYASLGDVGYLDSDGYLFLVDRQVDIVISGGVNIYPAEIEAELMALPGVADCAVFGVPDPDLGEVTHALVETQSGLTPDQAEILRALRLRLAEYKLPRLIEFRASLPRDENGKIPKRLLRDAYWREVGRLI